MSSLITYDPNDTDIPNRVLSFVRYLDNPPNLQNSLINADLTTVYNFVTDTYLVPKIYWLAVPGNNQVVQMSAPQMALVDSETATALLTGERAAAEAIVTSSHHPGKLERATADILIGEINALREWIMSFKAAVAAAATLAALKTSVAGLPDLPDRTLAQAKTAIISDISSGGEGD